MPAKRARKLKLFTEIVKNAESDQHGMFSSFQGATIEENTRDKYLRDRYLSPPSRSTEGLYNLAPEHRDSEATISVVTSHHLSTRYVPGYPGLQARRVGDGVVQNPLTGEMFDYNEGFKLGDQVFNPGDVSMQTSLLHFANHLDNLGLVKEANLIDKILSKLN